MNNQNNKSRNTRFFSTALFVGLAATQIPALADKAQVMTEAYGTLPLSFEPNQGQTDKQVQFLSRGPGYTLFLTRTEAVLSLRADTVEEKQAPGEKYHNVRIQLVGANSKPRVSGVDTLPGKVNYFRGKDPKQWHTNIPTYAEVKYEKVYPGIDLVYYGNERQLEHDFVVAPGADPKTIRLAFVGAENFAVDSQGDLVFSTGGGELRLHKPLVYQEIGGKRREVEGRYLLHPPKEKAKAQVGFHLAAYDTSRSLVIDPVLAYSTFLGGSKFDVATSIAVDSVKNVYVTGRTTSSDFPDLNGYDTTFNGGGLLPTDVFVTKLNAAGSARVYSTYLGGTIGGTNLDCTGFGSTGCHIAVDSFDNAYVTGPTGSSDFPTTPGAYDTIHNGGAEAFVTKLNATGTKPLLYSTFLGGSGTDLGHGIALDSARNVYVTGQTDNGFSAPFFPFTSGAYDKTYNDGGDAFVAKLMGADLQVSKTDSPDPIAVGSTLTYTITVKNNGPLGATGVQLTDSLPSSATFVSVTPSTCTLSGTTVTCPIGNLAKAGIKTITIKVKPTAKGGISNKATVKANELDPNTTNDTVTVTTTVVEDRIVLKWPLATSYAGRVVTSPFGDNWVASCGGLIKKHNGTDYRATAGTDVYAAEDGFVKRRATTSTGNWGGSMAMEHNGPSGKWTTLYWHISPVSGIAEGDFVPKGMKIATVQDISVYGHSTHFHFGARTKPYLSPVSFAGGLPQTNCGGYPAFPEYFVDPEDQNLILFQ